MKSKKTIIYSAVLFIFVIAGAQLLRFYRQPLGPALGLPIATLKIEPTLTTFPIETNSAGEIPSVVPPTATLQPLCGGPSVMNILAIGSDSRGANYLYGLSVRPVKP